MRLFVAVDLDEALRREAGRVARMVRDRVERSGAYGVSWVAQDNFHLTLRFLGEVNDQTADRVRETMATPFDLPPFQLALQGVGLFPPAGSARVIWLGVMDGATELHRLHAEVERRVAGLGFDGEDRPFSAHLTIARFRVPAPARVREEVMAVHRAPIGACSIGHVTLYQSQLSPKGARYTALVRAPLSGTVS